VLPSDIFLTQSWVSYLDTMRATVRSHDGVIAFEESPLSRHPYDLLVEAWILPSQSLALRAKRGDGIVAPPKTPGAIAEKISFSVMEILGMPEVQKRLAALGVEGRASTPEHLHGFFVSESKRWSRVVEAAKIPKQ